MPAFKKIERLCSKKAIEILFNTGKGKTAAPVKLMYVSSGFESPYPARCMFVVPKKKVKRANKRNTLKRRMREAYRLNKQALYNALGPQRLDMAFIYLGPEECDYKTIEAGIKHLLTFLVQQKGMNGENKAQQ